MLLLIFFAFLHCWLNAFAEMLRFGDRMFYRVGPGPGLPGSWMQGELGKDVGEDGGYVGCHLVPEPDAFAQFSLSQTLRYRDLQQRNGFFNKAAK